MIAKSFKSVIWVATVGGAALCCYMVSLRVATERADLARVDRQIVAAKRGIRMLQTELGTRGRMRQLEDWNANVLALSAPTAAQFVRDDVTLARFERRGPTVEERAGEVRMAAAETGAAAEPASAAEAPKPRMIPAIAHPAPAHPVVHQASYTPDAKSPLQAEAPAAKAPERQAKAAAKPVAKGEAKAEHAKAASSNARPGRQAKAAPARPASGTSDKKMAKAKPAAAGQVAHAQLAHTKPVRRPAAVEESAADR